MILKPVDSFSVKTVDMGSGNWPELIAYSLKTTGFAVVRNHGISFSKIEIAYSQWQDFFSSDSKLRYTKDSQLSGYTPFGIEQAKDSSSPDLKEFYHLFYPFTDVPSGVNIQNMQDLAQQMSNLARHILFVLQAHIPKQMYQIHGEPMHRMAYESPNNLLRILHYPALKSISDTKGKVRAAAHEDINLITILPAATEPGLEVMDNEGNWHKVQTDPGSVIVNVGDMLAEASGGLFRSTTHRVVNPDSSEVSRYSMPFFVHPRPEVRLSKRYTAEQYLNQRLSEIGLKK